MSEVSPAGPGNGEGDGAAMTDKRADVTGHGSVSLDSLIALNDELVALTRAGMPLESGLLDLSTDLPGRLRKVVATLGARMERGETLPDALAASGDDLPPVYHAVVRAGLRSGRLPVALEGLSTFARGYSEARRSIGLALWYPLFVMLLAYALMIFLTTTVIPRFLVVFRSMGLPTHAPIRALAAMGETAWFWGPILPAGVLVFLVAWSLSGRSRVLGGRRADGILRWFPWLGSMMRGFEAASFADLLALLVEHRVPYPEALMLAGDASGNPALARSSRELAAGIERGVSPGEALKGPTAFPPLLRWLLATGPQQGDLVAALKQMAGRYRGQARHQADKIRVFLPTLLLLGLGSTATLLYALALFVPLTTLWMGLAGEAP